MIELYFDTDVLDGEEYRFLAYKEVIESCFGITLNKPKGWKRDPKVSYNQNIVELAGLHQEQLCVVLSDINRAYLRLLEDNNVKPRPYIQPIIDDGKILEIYSDTSVDVIETYLFSNNIDIGRVNIRSIIF